MTTLALPDLDGVLAPRSIPESVAIAVDTEYRGPWTLTVQAAVRSGQEVALKIYYSEGLIPAPPPLDIDSPLQQGHRRLLDRVVPRPTQPLEPDLSPGRMLLHLLGLAGARTISRVEIASLLPWHGP